MMLNRIAATTVCLLLSTTVVLPAHAQPGNQPQEVRERIQITLDTKPVPPPKQGFIRGGTVSVVGGAILIKASLWVAVSGLQQRSQAMSLYEEYQELGYSADPDVYNEAWSTYRNAEETSVTYRVRGTIGMTTGILLAASGMLAIRHAAHASQELAAQKNLAISGAQVQLSPMGVAVVWTF